MRSIILPIALIVIVLYALPSILATLAGSHTLTHRNSTDLNCFSCHEYIGDEINASGNSQTVYSRHFAIAGNTNYTTFLRYGYKYNSSMGRIFVNRTGNWTGSDTEYLYYNGSSSGYDQWIDNRSGQNNDVTMRILSNETIACMMCHSTILFGVEDTHTALTVVGCTEIKCHGNAGGEAYGRDFSTHLNSGPELSAGAGSSNRNVHSNWFKGLNNLTSPYQHKIRFETVNITADYLACIGCHSVVETALNLTHKAPFDHANYSAPRRRYR